MRSVNRTSLQINAVNEVSRPVMAEDIHTGNRNFGRNSWSKEVSLPQMPMRRPERLDTAELLRLYHRIEAAVAYKPHRIIQIVGPTSQENNVYTGYELAWTVSALLGKSILFIDASKNPANGKEFHDLTKNLRVLSQVVSGTAQIEQAITESTDFSLCVATFEKDDKRGIERADSLSGLEVNGLLQELGQHFEMVILATAPVLNAPLAAILTNFVDGSVLVVEAEKTRRAETARSIEILSGGSSPLIGAVLIERRRYLPKWLARLFFG